ncbi:MAG: hypothetical protein HYX68_09445 [Planctomycetes bacterium]|nr:hypothetical protein [Planctomycetota bacterium]
MPPRVYPWLYRVCCLAAIGFLGAAAYCYFAPPPGPALHVVETEIKLSDAQPKQKRDVVFHLDNRSGKPMRSEA